MLNPKNFVHFSKKWSPGGAGRPCKIPREFVVPYKFCSNTKKTFAIRNFKGLRKIVFVKFSEFFTLVIEYVLFIGLKSLEILRVQILIKSAGRHFSTKLIKVQVLNKSMQVGIFQKINKICCTFIRDIRVPFDFTQ